MLIRWLHIDSARPEAKPILPWAVVGRLRVAVRICSLSTTRSRAMKKPAVKLPAGHFTSGDRSVAYTRLMPGGRIVLIQTRWHQDDLAGRLLREQKGGERWEVLSMPAIAESDDAYRKEGEPLWPEEFSLPRLEQTRAAIGSGAWASLYQQRPSAATGAVFKRDWWQFYRPPLAVPWNRIVQSWDTAFKKGTENDFSVCTTWGVTDNGYYLLHLWRERVEFPELKRVLTSLAEQWKPTKFWSKTEPAGKV